MAVFHDIQAESLAHALSTRSGWMRPPEEPEASDVDDGWGKTPNEFYPSGFVGPLDCFDEEYTVYSTGAPCYYTDDLGTIIGIGLQQCTSECSDRKHVDWRATDPVTREPRPVCVVDSTTCGPRSCSGCSPVA